MDTTPAPARVILSAQPRPMPWLAPVTRASFPFKSMGTTALLPFLYAYIFHFVILMDSL